MRQYIHRLRQEGELGTEIIAVILSACKRRALSSKQLSKATKPTSLPESVRLISKSLKEEEKPNLYETEDDKNKVVLYFTSLRGIRKTYEDCCCVRTVLRGYQVAVLIRGVHVGGMEEIKKLNDGGKLGEMLKGLPVCESVGACGCCGDPSVLWSTLLALFFPSSRQFCFFILSSSNLPPKHCF
ncbi:BnaCnng63650D [Brassica napus]|uniref:BnaCnng63650D protein n=1 Tax=Brassica napus TaxID=3708 RepID=A0A078JSS0_BRANA|nr:BnaCnng63650D [Brassica napus]